MSDARDYRELLKKYMAHVAEEEGVTFLEWNTTSGLTDLDRYELRVIEEELREEWKNG